MDIICRIQATFVQQFDSTSITSTQSPYILLAVLLHPIWLSTAEYNSTKQIQFASLKYIFNYIYQEEVITATSFSSRKIWNIVS